MMGMGAMGAMGAMGGMPDGGGAARGGGGGGGNRKSSGGGGSSRGRGRGGGGGGGGNARAGAGASTAMVAVDDALSEPAPPPQQRGDMSFELKAEISAGIAKLTANNISKVVDIIRETMPGLGHDDGEIELDVNLLDNRTLWRLYDFIKECEKSRKVCLLYTSPSPRDS